MMEAIDVPSSQECLDLCQVDKTNQALIYHSTYFQIWKSADNRHSPYLLHT